jgi:hypothetical protein
MGHIVVGGFWVTYGDMEYGITVFLFWWWVGSKIDAFAGGRHSKLRKAIKLAERIVALLLSSVLLYGSITGLSGKSMVARSVLVSMTLWGLGLLYYFAIRPYRDNGPVSN